uniref:Uncharacterized protein n=1 Tax=Rhizophora mucronata TaxID=61149 RepID=A0A2P2NAU6_RHIMU
MQKNLIHIFMV